MPPAIPFPTVRARSPANVLADLKEAKRDWEQALADAECAAREGDERLEAEHGDRMSEADTRIDDLRDEFAARFVEATGLTWAQIETAMMEAVL